MSLIQDTHLPEHEKTGLGTEEYVKDKAFSSNEPHPDLTLSKTELFHVFQDFRLVLEQKDAEIEALQKSNENLKLMDDIYKNIKEENLVLGGELSKKIKEISELRERLEIHKQDMSFMNEGFKESRQQGRRSHSLTEGELPGLTRFLSSSTAASERRSSELVHENPQLLEEIKEFKSQQENKKTTSSNQTEESQHSFDEKHAQTPGFADPKETIHADQEIKKGKPSHEESYELVKKGLVQEKTAIINQLNDKIKDIREEYERKIDSINKSWEERFIHAAQDQRKERTNSYQAYKSRYSTSIELELKAKTYENKIFIMAKQIERLCQDVEVKDRRIEGFKKRIRSLEDEMMMILIEKDKLEAMLRCKELEAEEFRLQLLENRILPRRFGELGHAKQKPSGNAFNQKSDSAPPKYCNITENYTKPAVSNFTQESTGKHSRQSKF